MTERRRDLLLLGLLAALLVLPGLGDRTLWNPDEARYAEVTREMRVLGEWLVPHLNGEVYSEKPPLLFWLIHLSSLITGGLNEWAARLPSAAAAVATVLLTYRMGRRLVSRRAGWLAAAVLATSVKVLWQGRFGQIDMLLCALVAAALWFWIRAYTEERPRLYPLFFLFAGLATLAKGPVGLLPPLLSVVAYLLVVREPAELRRMRIGRGLLLWAAVVLAWLVPAALDAGWGYFEIMVFKQNVTRYADPWHHFQPVWYYLWVLPAEFYPWFALLPSAVVLGWRRLRGTEGERRGYLFALSWTVVTLVFFSASPAKRSVYLLQMYPAMALLVGAALDRLGAGWKDLSKGERRGVVWPLGLLAGVAVLLPVVAPFVAEHNAERLAPLGAGLVPEVVAAACLGAAGALAAWWLARRGLLATAAGALAGGTAVMGLTLFLVSLPRLDAVKSARPLSELLVERMGPGETYAIYPRLDSPFLFYTERFAVLPYGDDELVEYASRPGRQWLLIERDDLARIEDDGGEPLPLVEVARDRDPRDGYILMTDPPAP